MLVEHNPFSVELPKEHDESFALHLDYSHAFLYAVTSPGALGDRAVAHAQGGVGHSESWRAEVVVCSRPKAVIRITEPMIMAAATNI
jgi:hypothetical protein